MSAGREAAAGGGKMRTIDVFNHFFPERIWAALRDLDGFKRSGLGKRLQSVSCLYDRDERLALIERFKAWNYSQILSLGPLDPFGSEALGLAGIGNDGMAELVRDHPGQFSGFVASLPMHRPEEALREAERAFDTLGANGLQVHSNVEGIALDHESFFPIFELAARRGKPVLLHPTRSAAFADYATEAGSKYEIWWAFGWPYETSAAMARMVFSGLFDRLPDLKVVAHHLGGIVPYLGGRIEAGWREAGSRTSDQEAGALPKPLRKPAIAYFKGFHADALSFGSPAAFVCGLDFFGPDQVLFASDCPFDPEKGPGYIRDTIAVIEGAGLSDEDRAKISHGNAERLFKLG